MERNRAQLMVVCQLATFIISGVVTTIGLIVPAAAAHFGVDVTQMAAQFTWFTGAGLVGQLCAFVVFDHFSIKHVLLASHFACGAALLGIHYTVHFELLSIWFVVFGMGISTAICGSSTLITQLWQGRMQQAAIVAQDAMFNGGGVIFAALAAALLARSWPFSSTYLITAGIIAAILVLISISRFNENLSPASPTPQTVKTEWNPRIVLLGIALLLFMLAKITIFIWAPQYVTEHFSAAPTVAGTFMSNIFVTALIGSIAGTWLVTRIKVSYLVYGFAGLSLLSASLITQLQTLDGVLALAFVYGLSVSATFNAFVALSLTQVHLPTHRNIAYMLLMSSLGSALAPLVSSQIVAWRGELGGALSAAVGLLVVVVALLLIVEVLSRAPAKPAFQPGGPQ